MQAKKKLTSLLLSLCMVLSVLPAAVFAADDPLVGGSQETDPYEPQMIDKIELEVDAPAEGKPADFSIQSQESDPYTVNGVYWSKCADEGDENTLVSMSVDDSFEKGWYRLVLYVYMDFNYAATEDIAVSLVGAQPERLVVDRELESTVVVDAWFAIDPPEKQEITRLAFDEIPVPAAGIDFGQAEDTIEKQVAQAHDEQVKIYSADYYEWSLDSYDDYHVWNTVYSGDEYDGSLAYGVRMLLYAQTGWYFGDTPPEVTVNGEKAKVISLDPYRIEVFMQFGDIVVDYIYLDSEIWPLDGQEIRMEPDNFTVGDDTLGAPAKSLFTIKDARMLIKPEGRGDWRDLTAEDTHFSTENDYTFYAEVEAADGVVFAQDAGGTIRADKDATVTVSPDGKSATLFHEIVLRVYRKAYARTTRYDNDPMFDGMDMTDWETKDHKSVPLTMNAPEPGVPIEDPTFGTPDGKEVIEGMNVEFYWYEVPYVGSQKPISYFAKTFEAGKTYMLKISFVSFWSRSYYVPPDFDIEYVVDQDGNILNYARKDSITIDEHDRDLFFWFTVGEVGEPEVVEQIDITGPEDLVGLLGQETDRLSSEQLSNFKLSSDAFVIDNGVWFYSSGSSSNFLRLDLRVNSGYRFKLPQRQALSYNGDSSNITYYSDSNEFDDFVVYIFPSDAEPHTHIYSEEWSSDENNHWHACECGAKADTAAHTYGEWSVTKEATETETGSKERTCTVCDYMQTETIPVIEHEHSYSEEWSSDENNHWHACECGAKADTAAHTYGEWSVTKEATETETGSKERTCTVCAYVQTEAIPAAGTGEPTDSTDPTDSSDSQGQQDPSGDTGSPQTGDSSNMMLWISLMLASCGGVLGMLLYRRKKAAAGK